MFGHGAAAMLGSDELVCVDPKAIELVGPRIVTERFDEKLVQGLLNFGTIDL